uniref:Alternative oxidase n=1 Tax=Timspurckia oligopyrenoides TaxID=708627 RepID=A0A7S0ZH80_9RHOD|mmetsp:Transcript_5137/g.8989  ORF Transcript_5137/g.8989 Transcript_5137/m.8989 type:complete len:340 (+) Transcript_5137:70-1089(+)
MLQKMSRLLLQSHQLLRANVSRVHSGSHFRSISTFGIKSERNASLNQRTFAPTTLSLNRYFSSSFSDNPSEHTSKVRTYDWITEEAEMLIARSYNRHKQLADKSMSYPPALSVEDLEHGLGKPFHYEPKNLVDKMSWNLMCGLRKMVHWFFREKYDHHAVVLETVAAVPGIVASFHRHLRSLRRMQRDHGWINPLQEEAENERMHLLIWMKTTHPTLLERILVLGAQGVYTLFYMGLYFTSPRAAHRLVGYLEEEAFAAYTLFLQAIDEGKIENRPAPDIAIEYYRLPGDAKLRDVVLHVRADECMHRDFNHMLSDKYKNEDLNSRPNFMGDDFRKEMM